MSSKKAACVARVQKDDFGGPKTGNRKIREDPMVGLRRSLDFTSIVFLERMNQLKRNVS